MRDFPFCYSLVPYDHQLSEGQNEGFQSKQKEERNDTGNERHGKKKLQLQLDIL